MTLPDENRVVLGSDEMAVVRRRHIPRGGKLYCCNIGSCPSSLCGLFIFISSAPLFLLLLLRSNISSPATRHLQPFHYPQVRPHHYVFQVQEAAAAADLDRAKDDPYSYATADIKTILVEEVDDDEVPADPKEHYTLGPKITDWDQQRAHWLQQNPSFPNFIKPNSKPRVLLVTGSSPEPCENSVGDHYLVKSVKNKIDYCRLHKIEIFYDMALLDAEMSGFWAKLPLIRKLLLSHPEVEFLWWMDSDAMFTDMAFGVPWERYMDHNVVFHGWKEMEYDMKNWVGLNTGNFLLRNCQWTLDLLDAWATVGPEGTVRAEAGQVLTRELIDSPVPEANDQSAMVYLLATELDKWGTDKVYLEKANNLHGYWGVLVDKYEEMIQNYHPGSGDRRWPVVSHFAGCKPCGKHGKYQEFERCLGLMDRAFHLAENQILQMYDNTRESLASSRAKRTWNETSNPLELRDEL